MGKYHGDNYSGLREAYQYGAGDGDTDISRRYIQDPPSSAISEHEPSIFLGQHFRMAERLLYGRCYALFRVMSLVGTLIGR